MNENITHDAPPEPAPPLPRWPRPLPDGHLLAAFALAACLGLGGPLTAVIFGHLSARESRKAGIRRWGMATFALWAGYLGLILVIIAGIILAVALTSHSPVPCDISNPAWPNC